MHNYKKHSNIVLILNIGSVAAYALTRKDSALYDFISCVYFGLAYITEYHLSPIFYRYITRYSIGQQTALARSRWYFILIFPGPIVANYVFVILLFLTNHWLGCFAIIIPPLRYFLKMSGGLDEVTGTVKYIILQLVALKSEAPFTDRPLLEDFKKKRMLFGIY